MNYSHNNKVNATLNLIFGDRTYKTLLMSFLLIIAMGLLRPNKPLGISEKKYWATKISWRDFADVVITGDSRILGGVSPGQMQKTLIDRRIVNYGFASNLYVPEYLEAVEQVLKRSSNKRTIILGITPHSLTDDPDITDQFSELKGLSKKDLFMDINFAALMSFFDYMSFRDALLGIFPGLITSRTQREFFADGWLAYKKDPPGDKKDLKKYRQIYEKCCVEPNIVGNLMVYVSKWTESNIRVYGFLMPTCTQMLELEQELSGFNLSEFEAAFKKAGGIWIEIDQTAYDSFDGSHLQREAALKLSQELASKIYSQDPK